MVKECGGEALTFAIDSRPTSYITMYVAINTQPRGHKTNINRTGTNNGGSRKEGGVITHVVHIYSNLLRVAYINSNKHSDVRRA